MSNRKTTFRVSPARRPWFRRLTPLAWALVGVVGLVVVLGSIGGVLALGGCTPDEVWEPTPTSSPVPSDTPQPTQGPTATPTVWYEGLVTPTVTVEPAPVVSETIEFPAWWSDQMTQDDEGNLLPPQEVQDEVWEAFIAGLGCFNITDRDTIDVSLEEVIQQAQLHLEDNADVLRVACNGFTSFEELNEMRMEYLPAIRLVEFGPRNHVICNDNPTRCATAVSVEAQGGIWWHEETCTNRGYETPCLLRLSTGEMSDQAPNRFYYAELEYNSGSEQWKIVYLEASSY
jgi:hypothetical protein